MTQAVLIDVRRTQAAAPLPARRALVTARAPLHARFGHEVGAVARRRSALLPVPAEPGQHRCSYGGLVGPEGECAECRARRMAAESRALEAAPGTEYADDEECGLHAQGPDLEEPHEGEAATIVCDGRGDYRVSPGWSATATCGIGACVQGHEESHARDWRGRWPNGCKNADGTPKPDGAQIPLGGEGYAAFLKASECRAYTGEVPCGERLLAAASDACKPTVTSQLATWRSRKESYCS